ncbi:MAG: hypothetical protein KGS72_19235 [Cyanobacteria bacterium REEB67]|nr:hypothetical protein [Cyanobacteria bacterium REEB67]
MTKNEFFTQGLLIIICGVAASLTGAITAAWWSAPLIALAFYLAFVTFSNRLLMGKLYGRIGKSPLTWMGVHAVLMLAGFAILLLACGAVFGVHKGSPIIFWGLTAFSALVLCQRSLRDYLGLLGMWIATRR